MTKNALTSTAASFTAGSAGAVAVEVIREILSKDLSWQQTTTIGIISLALVAGAAVINHYRYRT